MPRKLLNPSLPSLHRKSACDLFTAEFEINDIRPAARTLLTKGQTQDEISQYAGASISTRGRFVSVAEKRSGVSNNDRPLYLFIQGNTKDSVDLAVQRIEELIQMEGPGAYRGQVPKYLSSTALAMPQQPPLQMTMPPPIVSGGMAITSTTNSTCVEKIFIGLDHAPPSFDLRSRLIGTGGANLNYIRTETGAMATLRGRGSLFVDPMLSMESPEPIHLYIEHLRYEGLQAAKQLARNLIETLQQELVQFQMNPPMPNIHFSAQTTVVQQPHIYTQHTMAQPPPMMAVPPPQPLMQTHQMIHPHAAQGLVQIQPPGMPIPMKTLVPANAAPPHLSQPPPSLQHLQHPPAQTQIVVNQSVPIPMKTMVPMVQTQPNYQYQYIHTTGQEATAVPQPAAGPSGAVTIQHIYQSPHPSMPPQHVQSIMQPTTSFSDCTTTTFAQQMIRPPPTGPQAPPPHPQYITVQGNTAYMVPPPNLMQTTTQVPTSSIIYSSHPPPQMLQQPPNYSMAQAVHQVITVQQQQPPPQPAEIKLEDKLDECGVSKLEDFSSVEAQQRSTMVSAMTAPPPIMSVPPPTVQHIMVPNSYATNPQHTHLYGQAPMSHAAVAPTQAPTQQFIINGWPQHAATSQPQHTMHMGQHHPGAAQGANGMHGIPVEYRSGSGGITYQQIQHPIMTATTSMPVQYPQMPPIMKMNHQVPPPPFSSSQGVMQTGPPQPVPFPMQQLQQQQSQENGNPNMMRSGQKRKLADDNVVDGMNMPNKNGHGDPNNRHGRMSSSGGGGGGPFGNPNMDMGGGGGGGGGCRGPSLASVATTNTNSSNELNQDNYAAAGHRLDERNHSSLNQMTMPGGNLGDMGDPHQPNCGLSIEPPSMDDGSLAYQSAGTKPKTVGGPPTLQQQPPPPPGQQQQQQMSMVRCNIMGKPPPPLPHMQRVSAESTSILAQQQQIQRYANQW